MSGLNPLSWIQNETSQAEDVVFAFEQLRGSGLETAYRNPVWCYTRLYYTTTTGGRNKFSYQGNNEYATDIDIPAHNGETPCFVFGNRNDQGGIDTYFVYVGGGRFIVRSETSTIPIFTSPPISGGPGSYDPRSICVGFVNKGTYANHNKLAFFFQEIYGSDVLGGVYDLEVSQQPSIWEISITPPATNYPWTDLRIFYDNESDITNTLVINGAHFYDFVAEDYRRQLDPKLYTGDQDAIAFPSSNGDFYIISKNNLGYNNYSGRLNGISNQISAFVDLNGGFLLGVGSNRFVQQGSEMFTFTVPQFQVLPRLPVTFNPNYVSLARWGNDGTDMVTLPLYIQLDWVPLSSPFLGFVREYPEFLYFNSILVTAIRIENSYKIYAYDDVLVVVNKFNNIFYYFPNNYGHKASLGVNWKAGVFYPIDPGNDPDYVPFAPKILTAPEHRTNLVTFFETRNSLKAVEGKLPTTPVVSAGADGSVLVVQTPRTLLTPQSVFPQNRGKGSSSAVTLNVLPI